MTPTLHPADRHFVTALARGLDVLACFRTGDELLGNKELAERCKLPKSTVSRLTHTLSQLGYLIHVEAEAKYRLGMATYSLASPMVAQLDLREVASPMMRALADCAKAQVTLGACARLDMVYLATYRSAELQDMHLGVGSRLPVAVTSLGHAWLAGAPASDREAALERMQGDARADWPALAARIDRSLETYNQYGVTFALGSWMPGINSIARPLRLGGGLPTLAVSCGGPSFVLTPEHLMRNIRPRLIELTTRIEAAMRRRPSVCMAANA